jgi:hypothetical protein
MFLHQTSFKLKILNIHPTGKITSFRKNAACFLLIALLLQNGIEASKIRSSICHHFLSKQLHGKSKSNAIVIFFMELMN